MLIEAAILMPVLALFLFGILEWGLAFRSGLTVSDASRAGARVAAAMPRNPEYQTAAAAAVSGRLASAGVPADQIESLVIYRADPATGGLRGGGSSDAAIDACTANCWRFTWDAASSAFVPVAGGPSWAYTNQAACGGTADTDHVGVYVRVDHTFVTGMFGSGLSLTERTVMRLEPLPLSDVCAP
ncbi:MAG: pilus assembly protein [Acidimicrobiales bacterium]|nr:pilus assembly protein [Acidimicrobiales bacterium]